MSARTPALDAIDVLIGDWTLELSDAWFLEPRDTRQHGRATFRWLGDSFIELEAEMEGEPTWHSSSGAATPTSGSWRSTTTPGRRPGCST